MILLVLGSLLSLPLLQAPGAEARDREDTIVPRDWLVLAPVDDRGRRPVRPDAVFARHLLDREAEAPRAEQSLTGEISEERWRVVRAGENGRVEGPCGWAYTELVREREEIWIAELRGAWTLFVNGAGFCGDAYRYGFAGFPVLLREGENRIFVTGTRGAFRLRLRRPRAELYAGGKDVTLPDLLAGEGGALEEPVHFAIPVGNASKEVRSVSLRVAHPGSGAAWSAEPFEFPLPPLALAKAALTHDWTEEQLADPRLHVETGAEGGGAEVAFRLAEPGEPRIDTFVSDIDGGVQELGLRPATDPEVAGEDLGIVLSCHGAGVNCRGQLNAYASRPDLWIAVPTNRRPYGFDWQDWGRQDAYEGLGRALDVSGASLDRLYVTGHSMGGHGAWHLAANDPDRFAAVAPSAGWASFDTYTGRPEGELARHWHAADGASLTFELIENLAQLPTFVLHGAKDDNVPPGEARAMIEALEKAGASPASHFQEGAGHWWNADAGPGADCVTWPGIYELFAAHRRNPQPLEARFTSVDPSVDADHYFLYVHQPLEYGTPFSVSARRDPGRREMEVRTENVRTLGVRLESDELAVDRCVLDGVELPVSPAEGVARFERSEAGWVAVPGFPGSGEKGPGRSGPFKRAFDAHFLLVYGTAGDEERDRELLERARYDAACWLYRANAWVPVVSDEAYLAAGELVRGRNVILYGNRDSNAAWDAAVPEAAPVRARDGRIEIGDRHWEGDDLCCLFVYPRRGAESSLVGVFADSGTRGARLGYDLGTFVSGVGIPDLLLLDSTALAKGDGGVLAAGWFDHAWRWEGGFVERGAD